MNCLLIAIAVVCSIEISYGKQIIFVHKRAFLLYKSNVISLFTLVQILSINKLFTGAVQVCLRKFRDQFEIVYFIVYNSAANDRVVAYVSAYDYND